VFFKTIQWRCGKRGSKGGVATVHLRKFELVVKFNFKILKLKFTAGQKSPYCFGLFKGKFETSNILSALLQICGYLSEYCNFFPPNF